MVAVSGAPASRHNASRVASGSAKLALATSAAIRVTAGRSRTAAEPYKRATEPKTGRIEFAFQRLAQPLDCRPKFGPQVAALLAYDLVERTNGMQGHRVITRRGLLEGQPETCRRTSAPHTIHAVCLKRGIAAEEDGVFLERLSHQQSVEGIAVVKRQAQLMNHVLQ